MAKALLTRALSPLPVPHTTAHRYNVQKISVYDPKSGFYQESFHIST